MTKNSIIKIIKTLNQKKVRYLVVGGLAVVAHGYVRFTADIDLLLDFEEDNLSRAMESFKSMGYKPRAPVEIEQFILPENRAKWIHEKGLKVFSLWSKDYPATEIDLFIDPPLDFNSAFNRAEYFDIEPDIKMPTVSFEDIVTMKLKAGRTIDLEDIKRLLEIRDEGSEEEQII